MPHQHSFCKGEQAMSESFNTIPCLRMQPTSMLFSRRITSLGEGFLGMVLSCSVVKIGI